MFGFQPIGLGDKRKVKVIKSKVTRYAICEIAFPARCKTLLVMGFRREMKRGLLRLKASFTIAQGNALGMSTNPSIRRAE